MESLLQDIDLLGLKDSIHIVNETPHIYDFYRLADVLVCTSFEESFPRVLLEAMVFRLPIVSTDVNGIPRNARRQRRKLICCPPAIPSNSSKPCARYSMIFLPKTPR